MLESKTDTCPCKRKKCPRYANCKECLEHHKTAKHPAYCKRKQDVKEGKA